MSNQEVSGAESSRQRLREILAESGLATRGQGELNKPIGMNVSQPKKLRLDMDGRERERRKISNRGTTTPRALICHAV